MKIPKYALAQEGYTGLNLYDQLKWAFFFCIADLLIPIAVDPLGLNQTFLGLEAEQVIEVFFYFIIPILSMYLLSEDNYFACVGGFFIYFLCLNLMYHRSESVFLYFNDLYSILIILVCVADFTLAGEGETNHEEDFLM